MDSRSSPLVLILSILGETHPKDQVRFYCFIYVFFCFVFFLSLFSVVVTWFVYYYYCLIRFFIKYPFSYFLCSHPALQYSYPRQVREYFFMGQRGNQPTRVLEFQYVGMLVGLLCDLPR